MKRFTIQMGAIGLIGLFAISCASGGQYQGYMMKGSVIASTQTIGVIGLGTKDGATVGQVLQMYQVMAKNAGKTTSYSRNEVGTAKITEVIDENFSRVSLLNGKIEAGFIVEHK